MPFRDYFTEIQEIDASLTRQENLARLREAHKTWRRREGTDARNMENLIQSAIDVFGHNGKYAEFKKVRDNLQKRHSKLKPEVSFRAVVSGAALDGVITASEYRRLLDEAKKRGIDPAAATRIIRGVAEEHRAKLAKQVKGRSLPILSTRLEAIEFSEPVWRTKLSKELSILNHGGGALRGSAVASHSWIMVTPTEIGPAKKKQKLRVTVDTSKLSSLTVATGNILLQTNGGNARIAVSVNRRSSTKGRGHNNHASKAVTLTHHAVRAVAILTALCVLTLVGVGSYAMTMTSPTADMLAAVSFLLWASALLLIAGLEVPVAELLETPTRLARTTLGGVLIFAPPVAIGLGIYQSFSSHLFISIRSDHLAASFALLIIPECGLGFLIGKALSAISSSLGIFGKVLSGTLMAVSIWHIWYRHWGLFLEATSRLLELAGNLTAYISSAYVAQPILGLSVILLAFAWGVVLGTR